MKNLSEFVQKLRNKFLSEEFKKNRVKEILFEETGFDFKPENMEMREEILFLKAPPVLKSEVFIKKEKILKKIKEESLPVKDIF